MLFVYPLLLLCCVTCSVATRVSRVSLPISTPRTGYDPRGGTLQGRKGSVHLDLHRVVRKRARRRDELKPGEAETTAIGLGDALDITYNVLVQVGRITTPLVLDTGSADLWVLSDAFSTNVKVPYPLYPPENFEPVAEARLLYGDSRTGTHASGLIGMDRVGIAGLVLGNQYFASINDTNTPVLDTGSAGIFGLGFPVNSLLWNELYTLAASSSSPSQRRSLPWIGLYSRPRFVSPLPMLGLDQNLGEGDNITGDDPTCSNLEILSSFDTYGPLLSRLVLNGASLNNGDSLTSGLASPQFSVALQRTTPSVGGNIGTLSLGALPPGVRNTSFAWSPVRRYTPQQNGIVVPQASNETYPYAWEIPLDSIYFDGVRLQPTALGDVSMDGVGHSALIDTGNSLIRGPADVIVPILSMLLRSTSHPSPFATPAPLDTSLYTEEDYISFTSGYEAIAYAYPCEEAHSLVFEFSGRQFQVDPRDFGRPLGDPDAHFCVPNLAPTDPPKVGGYLYSWSIGEPFLRSVLSTFYYGNLTHPSTDLPRIGFLSTVPDDAALRLAAAVQSAKSADGYPETTITAPMGTHTDGAVTTDSNGVLQANEPSVIPDVSASAAPSSRSSASYLLYSTLGADLGLQGIALLGALFLIVWMGVFV